MGLALTCLCAILCCGVVTVCNIDSSEVSTKVTSYSFDFVMTQLIKLSLDNADMKRQLEKQNVEQEKQQLESADMKKHLDKLSDELEAQKTAFSTQAVEVEQLRKGQTTRGSSYIRWGRTTCSGDTDVLYKGYSAGRKYTDPGAGSNYLCLHDQPQWSRYVSGVQPGLASNIYGVQYEISDGNVFSYASNDGNKLNKHPVPCAMCFASTRSATVMIPARTDCPDGWTKEYQGYIASSHMSQHVGEYVCLDHSPETATGASYQNQGLIYSVEVMCGTLPCSRYADGQELTCVVCSK